MQILKGQFINTLSIMYILYKQEDEARILKNNVQSFTLNGFL